MAKKLILMSIVILSLVGCESLTGFTTFKAPTDRHAICSDIKRKLVFYNNDPNLNPEWSSPTKRAELLQQYRKYDCDNLDEATSESE